MVLGEARVLIALRLQGVEGGATIGFAISPCVTPFLK